MKDAHQQLTRQLDRIRALEEIIMNTQELIEKLKNFKSETIHFQGLEYKTIQSPTTGRVWLDRNLGASDIDAYGGYFEFNEANCPDGFEVPGIEELDAEFPNDLKSDIKWMNLPFVGFLDTDGRVYGRGGYAHLWSSTESGCRAYHRRISDSNDPNSAAFRGADYKVHGFSVRLIMKEK